MRTRLMFVCAIAMLCCMTMAWAAEKTYQVTGPITELTDSKIVVDKSGELHQIARNADTKVTGELKVGEKVTVKYTMTATSIEVKGGKAK